MRDSDSVPLWRDFLVFTGILARRSAHYGYLPILAFSQGVKFVFIKFCQLKSLLIRLFMRRAGILAPVQRLGFLTLSGSAVFSLLLAPSLSSQFTEFQLQNILDKNVSQDESLVLASASDTLIERKSPVTIKPSDPSRQEIIEYEVQGGDSLSSIGEKYLVSVEALAYVNNISSSALIHPGDKITIPPVDGLIYKVEEGDNLASIAAKHNISAQVLVDANLIEAPFIIHAGDELVVPGGTVPTPEPQKPVYLTQLPAGSGGLSLQALPEAKGAGNFMVPTAGSITQYFNWYHPAIDIANRGCGNAVLAADSGNITFAGWWVGGGGNSIFIDHGNGFVTKYAHLSGFEKTGGQVAQGEVIGYTGATGRAYGCHLHYVIEQNGRAVNPLSF